MNYYQNYKTAHLALKIRAIYINNMLSEMDVPYEILQPVWCGVDINYLKMEVDVGTVVLTEYCPYEDYQNHWTISTDYLDKDDEWIKQDYIKHMQSKYDQQKTSELNRLVYQAEVFGYELIKKGSLHGI